MIPNARTLNFMIGPGLLLGILVVLTACTGAGPSLRPAAESTSTTGAVAPIAPAGVAPAVGRAPAPQPNQAQPGAAVSAAPPKPAAAIATSASAGLAPQVVQPSPALAPATDVTHGIVVTGSGQEIVRPDQATVMTGVQTRGQTAQQTQQDNNTAMAAVINAIKALNIPEKDIQTAGVSLSPVMDQGQTVTGYVATNTVTVTVENIDQAGAVLDAAVRAGSNESGSIRFGLKDQTAARNRALAAAASDARSKANALAAALGVQVTGIQSVAEASPSFPIFTGGRGVAAAAAALSVPIEPGELSISAQVTIVFSY